MNDLKPQGRIINQLAILMAHKRVKIIHVSKATGISRTTLTSLYHNRESGITYDTLVKLCAYFNCTIGDFWDIPKKSHT